jgi:hypothetical protein
MHSFRSLSKWVNLSQRLVQSFHCFGHIPSDRLVFKPFCCYFSRIWNTKLSISWTIRLIWIERWDQMLIQEEYGPFPGGDLISGPIGENICWVVCSPYLFASMVFPVSTSRNGAFNWLLHACFREHYPTETPFFCVVHKWQIETRFFYSSIVQYFVLRWKSSTIPSVEEPYTSPSSTGRATR